MTRDLIIGIDAGTSVLKSVAFTSDGAQVGMASHPNSYARFARDADKPGAPTDTPAARNASRTFG